jgi:hypothetical protein
MNANSRFSLVTKLRLLLHVGVLMVRINIDLFP